MIENFDPNDIALADNNVFGLPTTAENAELIIIPMPWEVTVSYRNGTARAPEEIFIASRQIDLYDVSAHDMWKYGYYMEKVDNELDRKNDFLRHCAELVISNLSSGGLTADNEQLTKKLKGINQGSKEMVENLYTKAKSYLDKGKMVALLGGDHSTPLGLIKAVADKYDNFGILHIDAHFDFRNAYEGFIYSHASIMYNVLEKIPQVKKMVQLGIRDYCDEEVEYMRSQGERVKTFFDQDVKERLYEGDNWKMICDDIIEQLPQNVYISFDIDGLDPKLCANTGTPVNGGYEVEQIMYLFRKLVDSGRKIIGFDLVEVACGELAQDMLDANVGAHILYKMCNIFVKSQKGFAIN